MGRLSRNGISLAVCLFLLCGCSMLPRLRPPAPAPSRPVFVPAAPFWEKLAARRGALQSVKGLAHVQAVTGRGSVTLDDVVVVARQPQALRLEGIGPFGQPLFLFVTNGDGLELYLIRQNRLVRGRATSGNFQRLFGIGVAPQALVRVLLGDVPLDPLPTGGDLLYLQTEGLYLWEGAQAGPYPKYRVWFDAPGQNPMLFRTGGRVRCGGVASNLCGLPAAGRPPGSGSHRYRRARNAAPGNLAVHGRAVQRRGIRRPVSRAASTGNRHPGARGRPGLIAPPRAATAWVTRQT